MMPPYQRRLMLAIYPLFAVSGFCGLIYESIWSHYLKLFLGHAAYAQSVVLIVFIGGMALGAWLCGRFAERIKNPLVYYAIAEVIVGVFGIFFHYLFVAATAWGYEVLLPATCSAEGLCFSSWALAAVLILPQSILLGTTFPLMTVGALRIFPEEPGRRVALLYFLNSFGAVFGVLASVFVLVPLVGLPGASLVAGCTNVLLAAAIYLLARMDAAHAFIVRSARPAATAEVVSMTPRLLLWIALLTGLSSFIYEIVWIRMLSLVLGSSTHAFELMLASFILGIALGGAWIRKRIDRLTDPRAFLACVQIVMGMLALLSIVLYDKSFDAMAWLIRALALDDNGYVLFNVASALIAMAIMLPATFMAGMTLPLLTYLLLKGGYGERSVGYVYAWNTLGAIAGVLIGVHVGLPLLGLKFSLIGAAALDVALGVGLLWTNASATPRRMVVGVSVACALALGLSPGLLSIDPARTASGVFRYGLARLANAEVLFNRDGKTATVSVTGANGRVAIQTNGKPDAAIQVSGREGSLSPDEPTMVLLGALPLAHKPDARTAAVIGFGSGLTTATLLGAPTLERVDTIEIEPMMVEGARAFGEIVAAAHSDPRSRLIYDDAKSYFARSRDRYDIIVSEPSNPWVAGVASLYTEEFYASVLPYLEDKGLFVQWVQTYEFDSRLLASILLAARTAFKDFIVYSANDTDLILVARKGGQLGPASEAAFSYPVLASRLAQLGFHDVDDLERRRVVGRDLTHQLFFFDWVQANSDYFPIVDLEAPRARFRRKQADALLDLTTAPVPMLEMLERRARLVRAPSSTPPRYPDPVALKVANAQASYEELAGMFGPNPRKPGRGDQSAAVAGILLVSCAAPQETAEMWDHMVALAARINPLLTPGQLDALWQQLERSPCLAKLPPRFAQWLALFRATGNRDGARMAQLAGVLLEQPGSSKDQIDYLVAAQATGHLVSGSRMGAQIVLREHGAAVSTATRDRQWYRLLRILSGTVPDPSADSFERARALPEAPAL